MTQVIILQETELLKPVATTIIPARTEPFDSDEFYSEGRSISFYQKHSVHKHRKVDIGTSKELWDDLVLHSDTLNQAPERSYVSAKLKQKARDSRICRDLPEEYLSKVEDVAYFVDSQSWHTKGILLTDGSRNIFYVVNKEGKIFTLMIVALYIFGNRQWYFRFWDFDFHDPWILTDQVLIPGTAVL